MTTIELPEGLEHGTPEGHQAGCKGERNCPARYTHGMTCTDAHVRSVTTPDRYFKAKARGAAPEQIARTLKFRPATRAEDAAAAAEEERRSEAARHARRHLRTARRETPEPAQPLAEHSHDPSDTTPAPAGEVAAAPPAKAPAEAEEVVLPAPTAKTPAKPAKRVKPKTLTQALNTAKAKRTPPARDRAPQNLVRAWARENGIDVNPRGSVRTDVVNAYLAAHPDPTTSAPAPAPAKPTVTAEDLDAWATDHPPIENITDRIDELRPRIDMPTHTPATTTDSTLDGETTAPPANIAPASPGEFAARWNALTEDDRMAWITGLRIAIETSRRCHIEDHTALVTLRDTRPDWATVATTTDLTTTRTERDRARALAARLEQELAHTTEQLHTAHTALTTALAAWEAASDRAAAAERAALIAEGRAVAAEKRASSAETLRFHESHAHEARMDLAAVRRAELNDIIESQQERIEQLETAAKATWWRRAS